MYISVLDETKSDLDNSNKY